jgi:hypothetical protein
MRRITVLVFVLLPIIGSEESSAATMPFASRAQWEASVPAFSTEDFETTPIGGISCPEATTFICPHEIVIDAPLLDVVIPAGVDLPNARGIVEQGDVNGTREYVADLHSGVLVLGITFNAIVFPDPILAFAVDLRNVLDSDVLCYVDCGPVPFPMTIELAGAQFALAADSRFFGVTSTVPFTSVVIRSTNEQQGLAVLPSLDNVSFSLVPEPSSAILIGLGLAVLARGHVRRRAV